MLVNQITDEILTPLCDETRRLFRPLLISQNDRLHIKMQNKQFRLEARNGDYNGSYNARVRFMDIIPGHNRVSERYITADATDLTCLLISYHWQPHQLLFEDDLAATTYHYRIANFVKQTARVSDRNNVDEFHILDSADLPLARYQKIGVKASIGQEGFGLFMEQGTGKTAVAIARMCNEAAEKEQLYTMLVVCPAAVLLNWKQEIKRFASLPGRTTIIDGTKLDRFKKLTDAIAAHRDEYNKYTAAIISIDNVYSTKDILKIVPWDLCVLDESHNIKDQRTQR